jgi:hypothetical protein
VNISPAAVARAAAASAVLASASAAVLVVGAARTAAARAATRIAEYDVQLDRAVQARARGEIDEQIWPRTAAHVVELNARIALFEARAHRAGVRVAVPPRLILGGCVPWRASAWCVRTAERLRTAQFDLSASTARQRPERVTRDRFHELLSGLYRGALLPVMPPVSVLEADVQVALRSVDLDAHDAEYARTLAAVAAVAEHAARPADARPFLFDLTLTVGEINKAVARRRLAAQWLLALEDPIVVGTGSWTGHGGTVAKLRAVVSGDGELGAGLSAESATAITRAEEAVRRNYLR